MNAKIEKALYGYQAWDANGNYTGYWGTEAAAKRSVATPLEVKPKAKRRKSIERAMGRGDAILISKVTGYTPHMVYSVNAGRRKNETIAELVTLSKKNRAAFADRLQQVKTATEIERQIKSVVNPS